MDDKFEGFLYAAAGATIALLVRWWIEIRTRNAEQRKHAEYLAVRVVYELDRFALGCIAVGHDHGQPEDPSRPSTRNPTFEPHTLPVDWKSIHVELVYRVMNLPSDQAAANGRIAWESEEDFDGSLTLRCRREEYIALGLKAAGYALRLREIGGLPDAEEDMRAQLLELQAQHLEARARVAARQEEAARLRSLQGESDPLIDHG